MSYLLLFDHYEKEEDEVDDMYGAFEEEDTLEDELNKAIAEYKAKQPNYPPGHPVFRKEGINFVQARPMSAESGFKHLPGKVGLQKI